MCEVLDLLADCNISRPEDNTESEEIKEMGLWHSTPLAHRHKSKISLTWVLKENLENSKLPIKKIDNQSEDIRIKKTTSELDRLQVRQRFNENERQRKCSNREVRERVVGRNEDYHNLRFRSACEEFAKGQSCSDDTSATEEYSRRKHKHRHRRKKKSHQGKFGYDIRDLDSFLSEVRY